MSPETLSLIQAANSSISQFLAKTPGWLAKKDGMPLGEIQNEALMLESAIGKVGRSLGHSCALNGLGGEANTAASLYAENLEELKGFLMQLQTYAEARRGQLKADARKLADFLDWSKTVKETFALPE